MREILKVSIMDGKYTVIQKESGAVIVLRYGEFWQEGTKLILAMAQEIDRREKLFKWVTDKVSAGDPLDFYEELKEIMEQQNNMPKIPQPDVTRCWFPKYKGELWKDIINDGDGEGKRYMEWLVGFDGPKMTDMQYEYIQNVLEEDEDRYAV